MIRVHVEERSGAKTSLDFEKPEITMGRLPENDIVLPRNNISKAHARVIFKNGELVVMDLKSTNGTFVNNHRILSPQVLVDRDRVFMGDFVLRFQIVEAGRDAPPPPGAFEAEETRPRADLADEGLSAPRPQNPPAPPDRERYRPGPGESTEVLKFLNQLEDRIRRRVDVLDMTGGPISGSVSLEPKIIEGLIDELESKGMVPKRVSTTALKRLAVGELIGFGPLEQLLVDPAVLEIFVGTPNEISLRTVEGLSVSPHRFSGQAAVETVSERLLGSAVFREDGARWTRAVTKSGWALTRLETSDNRQVLRLERVVKPAAVAEQLASKEIWDFFALLIKHRANVVVSCVDWTDGAEVLSFAARHVPPGHRAVGVSSWPGSLPLKVVVPITERAEWDRQLDAVSALQPDNLFFDHLAYERVPALLSQMSTGQRGVMFPVHGRSPLGTLENLAKLWPGAERGAAAVVAENVQFVFQTRRFNCGTLKIVQAAEVLGVSEESFKLQDVFIFKARSPDAQGKVQGRFLATGTVPRFVVELKKSGITIADEIFQA